MLSWSWDSVPRRVIARRRGPSLTVSAGPQPSLHDHVPQPSHPSGPVLFPPHKVQHCHRQTLSRKSENRAGVF